MSIFVFDTTARQHRCQDETATLVNDRWLCNCPGGPYFAFRDDAEPEDAKSETDRN